MKETNKKNYNRGDRVLLLLNNQKYFIIDIVDRDDKVVMVLSKDKDNLENPVWIVNEETILLEER